MTRSPGMDAIMFIRLHLTSRPDVPEGRNMLQTADRERHLAEDPLIPDELLRKNSLRILEMKNWSWTIYLHAGDQRLTDRRNRENQHLPIRPRSRNINLVLHDQDP